MVSPVHDAKGSEARRGGSPGKSGGPTGFAAIVSDGRVFAALPQLPQAGGGQ